MLRQLERATPQTAKSSTKVVSDFTDILQQQQIPYTTAYRWQQLAEMPELEFERHIEDAKGTRANGGNAGGVIGGSNSVPPIIPTLAELGLDKKTSSLAQRIASLSEEQFESVRSGVTNQYPTPAKLGLEAYNHAAEVKVRAERKAGEMLVQLERSNGGRPKNSSQDVTSSEYANSLQTVTSSSCSIANSLQGCIYMIWTLDIHLEIRIMDHVGRGLL